MTDYVGKLNPFPHQQRDFDRSKNLDYFGILWEQGTGKTKLGLDTVGYLFRNGRLDGLFILAPDVIHENWIVNEIPKHLPDDVLKRCLCYAYHSRKVKTQKHLVKMKRLETWRGLSVLAMTYDALSTPHGQKAAAKFLQKRKSMAVADESTRIKNPKRGIRRTRAALRVSKFADFRRVMTGTPVDNCPFDIYSQMLFLHPDFWGSLGISSFQGFKTKFGIWEKKYNYGQNREYDELVEYRHLDQLKEFLTHHCSRVTKDQVLDLPPKLYSTLRFDLSPKQQRIYDEMQEHFMTVLDDGSLATAELVITQLLRLQQIACGYIVNDDEEFQIIDPKNSPRLDLLVQKCEDMAHPGIIWAKFRKDIELICDALGDRCRRADGSVDGEDRLKLANEFQDGGFQFIVSNPAAMGEGMTLHAARTVMYYNNGFKLSQRLQSEDRAHRIGQEHPVDYIDFVAAGTVDEPIIDSLLRKMDLASQVTGDVLKKWLTKGVQEQNHVL